MIKAFKISVLVYNRNQPGERSKSKPKKEVKLGDKAKQQGSDRFSVRGFAFYRDVENIGRMAQKLLPAVALSASSGNIEMSLLISLNMWDIALCYS